MESEFRFFAIVFICGMVGVVLAFILYMLNAQGIVIDEYITESATITITDLMAIAIIMWTAIGLVLAAFSR